MKNMRKLKKQIEQAILEFNKENKREGHPKAKLIGLNENIVIEFSSTTNDDKIIQNFIFKLEQTTKNHVVLVEKIAGHSKAIGTLKAKFKLQETTPIDEILGVIRRYEEGTPPKNLEGYED